MCKINEFEIFGIPFLKIGKKIHIKKKNRGKFKASAKRAGQSVQEHARSVLNNPKATPLQKKRANFARNAAKWKHQEGSKIHKPNGHKSILDNGWINKHQQGGGFSRIDFKGLQNDPEYKKDYNWRMNINNLSLIQDSLISRKAGYPQRIAVFSQVIPENGGNTSAHGNGAYGYVGWRGSRAKNLPKDAPGQAHKLMEELFGTKVVDWTHGGAGTNVNSGAEMKEFFMTTPNSVQATKALMKGYVRPPEEDRDKRIKFVKLLKRHMK